MSEQKDKKTIAVQATDPEFIADYEAHIEAMNVKVKDYLLGMIGIDMKYGLYSTFQKPEFQNAIEQRMQREGISPQAVLMELLVPGSSQGMELESPPSAAQRQAGSEEQDGIDQAEDTLEPDGPSQSHSEADEQDQGNPAQERQAPPLQAEDAQDVQPVQEREDSFRDEQAPPGLDADGKEVQEEPVQEATGGEEQGQPPAPQESEEQPDGIMNLFAKITPELKTVLNEHKQDTEESVGNVLVRLVDDFVQKWHSGTLPENFHELYKKYAAEPNKITAVYVLCKGKTVQDLEARRDYLHILISEQNALTGNLRDRIEQDYKTFQECQAAEHQGFPGVDEAVVARIADAYDLADKLREVDEYKLAEYKHPLVVLAGYCRYSGYRTGASSYNEIKLYDYLYEAKPEKETPFDPAHFGEEFTQQAEQGPTM